MNSHRAHSRHHGLSCDHTLGSSLHWMFSVRICISVPSASIRQGCSLIKSADLQVTMCTHKKALFPCMSWKECFQWSSHCCRQSQWKHWTASEKPFLSSHAGVWLAALVHALDSICEHVLCHHRSWGHECFMMQNTLVHPSRKWG
jgi:hypothetical protein